MKNSTTFDAIKEEMKIQGVTQQQISIHLKAENNHLWKTIRKGTVRIEAIEAICAFLKISVYIINDEAETETKLF